MMTTDVAGLVDVGDVRLYHEVHGQGPPLLLIPGGVGDAGEWAPGVPYFARHFTVVVYDRRGFSRSDKSPAADSLAVHADDAAALLGTLHLEPALIVGQSSGALIASDLVARHADVVRSAVLFEAPLFGSVPGNEEVAERLRALVEEKMSAGGPRVAMEAFMRANAGDEAVDGLRAGAPETFERALDNGANFFAVELPAVLAFTPDLAAMTASGVPLTVLLGSENRDTWYGKAAAWLAEAIAAEVVETPGGHASMHTHPAEFAAAVARADA